MVPDIETALLALFIAVSSIHLPVFSLPQPYLSMALERPSRNRRDPQAEKSRIYDMCAAPCNPRTNLKVQPAPPTSKAGKVSTLAQYLPLIPVQAQY